ncbi:MAG: hypothetical protein IKK83_04160 [Clostridia bacterium]|nr:hypothetical protein [Clostridia bacterium]
MSLYRIGIFALALCLLLALGSCGGHSGGGEQGDSVENDAGSDSVFSTESADSTVSDGESEAVITAARELLVLDGRVADIFARAALAPYAEGLEKGDYGYLVTGDYYRVSASSGYGRLEDVAALLDSVYTEESGIKNRYLTDYPRYGSPALRQDYVGNTEYCHSYVTDFNTDPHSASLSLLEREGDLYRLQYSEGTHVYCFEMRLTADGYRLEDSLLLLSEEQARAQDVADTITEDIGSAGEMRGSCLWVNVFADCLSSDWDGESEAAVKAMVEEARGHLLSCAAEYGVEELSIELSWVNIDLGISPPDYLNGARWALEAFEGGGYGSYPEFARSLCQDGDYDNVFINFHFNEHGRSFCLPCDSAVGEDSDYYYEHMVTYYSQQGEGAYFACSAVYMHELLHAFGAVDLYDEWLTEQGGDLAALYFDYDIMRREPWDIKQSYVSELTAKLIGWSEGLDPQLRAFFKEIR